MHALSLVIALAAPVTGPSAALDALLKEEWEFRLRENPLEASRSGDHRYDGLMPSVAQADLDRQAKAQQAFLERAADDRPQRAVSARSASTTTCGGGSWRTTCCATASGRSASRSYGGQRLPHRARATCPTAVRSRRIEGLRELHRAAQGASPTYVGPVRRAHARGRCAPASRCRRWCWTATSTGSPPTSWTTPEKSVFFEPFAQFPAGVPGARSRVVCAQAGRAAVREGVVAGYRTLPRVHDAGVHPRRAQDARAPPTCRTGRAYYAHLVRSFTTLDLTPEQIHEIGHEGGRADPRRDGRRDAADRVHRRLPGVPAVPAHATRASTRRRPRSC